MAATIAVTVATVATVVTVATAATADQASPAAIAATATAAEIIGDKDDEYQHHVHFSKRNYNFNEYSFFCE
jgi:hypothetical protein